MRTYHLGELAAKPGFEDLSMEELGAITAAWRAMWFKGRIRYEDVPAPSSLIRQLVERGWLVDTGDGYDFPRMEDRERELARVRQQRRRARLAAGARRADVDVTWKAGSEDRDIVTPFQDDRDTVTSSQDRDIVTSSTHGRDIVTQDRDLDRDIVTSVQDRDIVTRDIVTSPSLFPPHPLSLSQENTPSLVLSSSQEITQEKTTGSTPSLTPLSHPPIVPPPSPLALSRRGEENVEAVTDQPERKRGPESLYDIMARMAKDNPAIDKWFQGQLAWRRANGGKNIFERDRPAPAPSASLSSSESSKIVDLPRPQTPASASSAKPSVSRSTPRLDIRLTREQWEAWRRFEDASPRPEEWREFREAWLGRGLLFPPTRGQRELLWPILDAGPTDVARWVSEAPSRQADEVVGYVLERWREVLRGVEASV